MCADEDKLDEPVCRPRMEEKDDLNESTNADDCLDDGEVQVIRAPDKRIIEVVLTSSDEEDVGCHDTLSSNSTIIRVGNRFYTKSLLSKEKLLELEEQARLEAAVTAKRKHETIPDKGSTPRVSATSRLGDKATTPEPSLSSRSRSPVFNRLESSRLSPIPMSNTPKSDSFGPRPMSISPESMDISAEPTSASSDLERCRASLSFEVLPCGDSVSKKIRLDHNNFNEKSVQDTTIPTNSTSPTNLIDDDHFSKSPEWAPEPYPKRNSVLVWDHPPLSLTVDAAGSTNAGVNEIKAVSEFVPATSPELFTSPETVLTPQVGIVANDPEPVVNEEITAHCWRSTIADMFSSRNTNSDTTVNASAAPNVATNVTSTSKVLYNIESLSLSLPVSSVNEISELPGPSLSSGTRKEVITRKPVDDFEQPSTSQSEIMKRPSSMTAKTREIAESFNAVSHTEGPELIDLSDEDLDLLEVTQDLPKQATREIDIESSTSTVPQNSTSTVPQNNIVLVHGKSALRRQKRSLKRKTIREEQNLPITNNINRSTITAGPSSALDKPQTSCPFGPPPRMLFQPRPPIWNEPFCPPSFVRPPPPFFQRPSPVFNQGPPPFGHFRPFRHPVMAPPPPQIPPPQLTFWQDEPQFPNNAPPSTATTVPTVPKPPQIQSIPHPTTTLQSVSQTTCTNVSATNKSASQSGSLYVNKPLPALMAKMRGGGWGASQGPPNDKFLLTTTDKSKIQALNRSTNFDKRYFLSLFTSFRCKLLFI